jgi:hypothetical protein
VRGPLTFFHSALPNPAVHIVSSYITHKRRKTEHPLPVGTRGSVEVEGLSYKPVIEFYQFILPTALGARVYSTPNKNEYQKIFLGSRAQSVPKADNLTVVYQTIF